MKYKVGDKVWFSLNIWEIVDGWKDEVDNWGNYKISKDKKLTVAAEHELQKFAEVVS